MKTYLETTKCFFVRKSSWRYVIFDRGRETQAMLNIRFWKKKWTVFWTQLFLSWYKIGEPSYLSKKKNEWHSKRIVTKEESTGSYTKYSKSCNIWNTKLENIVCSRDRIWNIWQKNGIEYVTCLTRSENYRTPVRIKEPKLEAAIGRK